MTNIRGVFKEYDSDYDEVILNMSMEGKSVAQICARLGISKYTLDKWKKNDREFDDFMTFCNHHAQSWWENQGHINIDNPKFNSKIWSFTLQNRFRDDYRNQTETTLKGEGEGTVAFVLRDMTKKEE